MLHDLLDGSPTTGGVRGAGGVSSGDDGLRVVFQPVVHLASRAVIGYEALTRGPRGTDLESPTALFAAARAARRVTELDWRCRLGIFDRALGEGLHPPWTLVINAEPETLTAPAPEAAEDLVRRAERDLSVVVDLPQQALVADPARLVAGADRIRSLGWRIAVQNLALDDASLGLIGLLAPDVIRLDLHALRRLSARRRAAVVASVTAEVERSGASLLAERVETEEDLAFVEHLGCEYAQGFLFGRAQDELAPDRWDGMVLPRAYDGQRPSMLLRERDTPFEVAATGLHRRLARKPFLIDICRELEAQAVGAGPSTMVLAAFQHARHFDAATAHRYRQIADSGGFVAAIGAEMAVEPVAGVRGAMLDDDDPLQDQWVLALLGPQHAVCMAALDMGDDVPEAERRFRYVLTHRRERVVAVARALLGRVAADHRPPPRVPIVLPPLSADGPSAGDGCVDLILVVLVGEEEVVGAREDEVEGGGVRPDAHERRLELVDLVQRPRGQDVGRVEEGAHDVGLAGRGAAPGEVELRHAESARDELRQDGAVRAAPRDRVGRRHPPVVGVGGQFGREAADVDVAVAEHDELRDRDGPGRGGDGCQGEGGGQQAHGGLLRGLRGLRRARSRRDPWTAHDQAGRTAAKLNRPGFPGGDLVWRSTPPWRCSPAGGGSAPRPRRAGCARSGRGAGGC